MKLGTMGLICSFSMLAITGLFMVGCDTTETSDIVITVTPSAPELTGARATTTFTAAGSVSNALALPLIWTVSDPNLGVIRSSVGVSAMYESTGRKGNNIITVHDQGQAEGMATVIQR